MSRNPLVVAIDRSDAGEAEDLAARLAGLVGCFKVGLELFVACGPSVVEAVRQHGPVFLDLKMHDIPNTVSKAARNAGRLGPAMLSVHALGGTEMMRAAVEGAAEGAAAAGFAAPVILGVTVLSSLRGEGLVSPTSLATQAVSAGAGGVVVSGEDVASVREALGPQALLVVPGIRPGDHSANDHVRVLSPREALARGADLLVVGRPITGAPDPAAAVEGVLQTIGTV